MSAELGHAADAPLGTTPFDEDGPCRLLIVEDRPADAQLVIERLRRSELDAEVQVVDDAAGFEAALGEPPDLILCDFNLPGFGALEALDTLARRGLDVPLIVISGALRDEDGLDCLRRGAVDYLLKDRPARLVPAIRQALNDHRHRTAIRRSEDAFRDRAGLLQAIFETVADPMVVVDDEGRSVELNPAARRLAMTTAGHGGPDATAATLEELFRRIGRGETDSGEIELPTAATGRRILEYTADRGFMTNRHLVVLHDVSVRRALVAEALQRHRLESVGRLAGGIAHDFNNILAAIVTFAEMALAEIPEGGAGRAEIDEVLHAADRAADLVGQILTFSRQQPVQPTEVDVRAIVTNLDSILRRPLGSHIALEIEATEAPATIFADRAQIEQVVVNLVVNARDAMPDGGRITIRIARQEVGRATRRAVVAPGSYVRLEVIDTGTGMDEATRARAFEPFFTTKPVGRGTGLGLATAYGTVQQLGGTISVDSEPGRGSRFVVLLPAVEPGSPEDAPPAGIPAATSAPQEAVTAGSPGDGASGRTAPLATGPRPDSPATILIAEDEPSVRAALARILGGRGYRTVVAADGLEALKAAHETAGIDLLVSDVVMPGMTGTALAARLLGEGRVHRVLLISGYRGLAPLGELEVDPRVAFLAKPFDVADLHEAVASALLR